MAIYSVEDPSASSVAVEALESGEVILIPTETVFGLTCDAINEAAVARLFSIKRRSYSKQSAVFLSSVPEIDNYAIVETSAAKQIIRDFLPGPLTVILNSRKADWKGVVGPNGKIGIRISSDRFVTKIAKQLNRPLIATSANISGQPECSTVADIQSQFASASLRIFFCAPLIQSLPSTVVDLTEDVPRLIREGSIPFAEIKAHLN